MTYKNRASGVAPYDYKPVHDAAGYDAEVTGFRVNPGGRSADRMDRLIRCSRFSSGRRSGYGGTGPDAVASKGAYYKLNPARHCYYEVFSYK